MSQNIIRDGYTRKAYIEPVERLHEELRFDYRPMLGEEVETIEQAVGNAESKAKGNLIACHSLAKQIQSWSEVDEIGEAVPVSAENVRRLQPTLRIVLYLIVSGARATDPIPSSTPNEDDAYITSLIEESEGNLPGATEEVVTEKN